MKHLHYGDSFRKESSIFINKLSNEKISVKLIVMVIILISVSTVSFGVCLYKYIKVTFVLLVGYCYLFRMADYFHMY